VAVFALMDQWIVAAGRTDPWLELGLEVMDSWQAGDPGAGQQHLADLLAALKTQRPEAPAAPDPVALALWLHHAGTGRVGGRAGLETSAGTAYETLCRLGEPTLATEVARLVRVLGASQPHPGDAAGSLLCSVHRAAMSTSHLASVPPVIEDQ
jgi:predicted metal-dependent HD superfamily phosphohydrolase